MSMTSSLLEEMCLDAMPVQIQEALSASGGDANQAADALLGTEQDNEDDSHLVPVLESRDEEVQPVDAMDALKRFQDANKETNKPRQLFSVSKMEGVEELK